MASWCLAPQIGNRSHPI